MIENPLELLDDDCPELMYGWDEFLGGNFIGPGHPNPEWRNTKTKIERKRDA